MKNIITNIVGFLLLVCGVYGLMYLELELIKVGFLFLCSGVLIYFKNATIKRYLSKGVKKYLS